MTKYDAIIIGSGFGGSMMAHQLVNAGMKVLMLERGGWVDRGPQNWSMAGSIDLTEHYDKTTPLKVVAGGNKKQMGLYACVGGPSVFYGGVSFRFREKDFEKNEAITNGSGATWPFRYHDIEPYYEKAEQLLNISGEAGTDPTEPPRNNGFPQKPAPLAGISQKVKNGAESLGLRPFQLPLAINYQENGRSACQHCMTCDTYACAISAKNDLATMVLPILLEKGLELKPDTVVTRLVAKNGRIAAVECVSKEKGERQSFSAGQVILSAGAMASPHLLLSSGLQELNPGGQVVGRYLMRHVNAIIFGIFPGVADKEGRFHKQLAILDYYFGHPGSSGTLGKLGSLQQVPTPPMGLVQNEIPGVVGKMLSQGVRLLTGLLAIAEDQPQFSNAISIDAHHKDVYGMLQPVISHHYSKRDLAAVGVLIKEGKKIMSKAGALAHYVHHIRTFSHAVGTVRMGADPATSALDERCQFRGVDNLYVVDGSFMPTSAALNPSLTIAANALRVGEGLVS
ncbi:MAG: GMC family oxidoreductase [Lewinellaceae bacterium]|nr:GMC family oxidoreductase [Saprospiraceae bacterium]MCB9339365.1 GMC family oxidoreductase [Lewinellaceae bacterium]